MFINLESYLKIQEIQKQPISMNFTKMEIPQKHVKKFDKF